MYEQINFYYHNNYLKYIHIKGNFLHTNYIRIDYYKSMRNKHVVG